MQNDIILATIWFVTILLSLFVFARVMNHKITGAPVCVSGIAFSVVLACFIYLLRDIIPFLRFVFMIFVLAIFLSIITKMEFSPVLTATIISVGISYGMLLVSTFISSTLIHFVFSEQRLILTTIVSVALQSVSVICLFRIKRFSKGIPFLQKKAAGAIGCSISGIIIITYSIINRGISIETGGWVITGTVLCVIGLIYWWRRGLTKQYRESVKERNIQDLERIIGDNEIQIKKLQEDNEMMARVIHRDNKILPALVESVLLYLRSDRNITSNGIEILEQIEQLLNERRSVLKQENHECSIPKPQTNPIIDGVIRHMMMRASAEGVKFEITEMSDVSRLTESTIPSIKLQTLLVDLLENAINATDESSVKHVLISLCEDNGIYDLCVYDSGVCFDAKTFISLGKKKTTTRIREGGSGIGYMEIFKILNESNASLTITEFEPEFSYFTKSISICFDDKSEHVLQTYRAETIMSFCSGDASIPLLKIMNSKAS
ncbi:MAG: hypothetical protein FWE83_05695 [Oscillospiraceae bacterium]|nr:hypothetical protein [Oscillospiraceae bacterium]